MHRRQWRDRLYGWLGWFELTFGVIAAFSAGLLRVPVETAQSWWPFAGRTLEILRGQEWWVVPLAIVLAGLCHIVRKYLGPPWVWNTIHSLISAFRDDVFKKLKDDPMDHHRVTLFRYRRPRFRFWKWSTSGWLVAVARSGHQTQARIPAFRAHDTSDDSRGVAGRAYGKSDWVFVPKRGEPPLPDVLANQDDMTLMKTYAERTKVTVEWLKHEIHKGKHPAMSFAAFRVIGKKREPWGVIVLDSREPDGILQSRLNARFSPYGKALAPLLERV